MRIRLALLCLSLTLVRPAAAETAPHWLEVRSDHFIVITDTSDKQAHHIAFEFERMRSFFNTILPRGISDASSPIIVFALKDKKGFSALEPSAYLAKNQLELAGLFLRTPGSNYILVRLDSQQEHPFATVYHEYTHFVMRKALWIPLWLGEGLAEFYQNTDIEDKDVRLGQPSPDDIYYLRDHPLMPLATLLTVDHTSPYYHDEQKGSVFYAESWALVHYIEINDSAHKTNHMHEYAENLVNHQDPITAAQNAFGDLKKLQSNLNNYVSNNVFSFFKVNKAITVDEATLHSVPISTADANAIRADVLAYDDRQPEAKALAESVLRDEPKNVLAMEALGSLCTQNQDRACAKKWFGQAVELNTQSSFALFNYAVLAMQDNDRDHDDTVEASLKRSIQLNADFAPAYDALAQFYASRGKNFTEAHTANIRAISLEPEELIYRLNASNVLMQAKQPDGAISILRTAKQLFPSPGDQAVIDQRISNIQDYQAAIVRSTTSQPTSDGSVRTIVITGARPPEPEPAPYPADTVAGQHHTASGTLHAVKCSYPTLFTLELVQPQKTITLYSNNYMKIPFSTANFVAKDSIDVCQSIEGMKARIDYSDVSDPRVKGRIVSIELSK